MRSSKSKSHDLFQPAPGQATYQQVMEMVKRAEKKQEQDLQKKRHRLQSQMDDELYKYNQEIRDKFERLREYEYRLECENLEKMKIDRELDRQKYVELKQLQQHMQNSEELRLEMSKQLIEECNRSRDEHIQEKLKQESTLRATENKIVEEARRLQLEELQREQEADRKLYEQRICEAKQQHAKQMAIKVEQKHMKRNELEIERELLQKTDEALKKSDEKAKMTKQQEIQSQKEFLQYQIEQRKNAEKVRRQREIQSDKVLAAFAKEQMEREATEKALAKKVQHTENAQFIDYMNRMRADKQKDEFEKFDLNYVSLINESVELDAEAKRQERKQQLNAEQRSAYLRKLHEKHNEKLREKQREALELQESQKRNSEYELMMARKRAESRLQFQQDLDQQIKLKMIEIARNQEQEANNNKRLDEINNASGDLTKKLLNDEIDGLLPEHPFYYCFKSKTSNQ